MGSAIVLGVRVAHCARLKASLHESGLAITASAPAAAAAGATQFFCLENLEGCILCSKFRRALAPGRGDACISAMTLAGLGRPSQPSPISALDLLASMQARAIFHGTERSPGSCTPQHSTIVPYMTIYTPPVIFLGVRDFLHPRRYTVRVR